MRTAGVNLELEPGEKLRLLCMPEASSLGEDPFERERSLEEGLACHGISAIQCKV